MTGPWGGPLDPNVPIHSNPRPPLGGGSGPKPPTAPTGPSGSTGPAWTSGDQSAFDLLNSLLNEYGLSSLSGFLHDLIMGGTTDSSSLMLALQGTNEWKQRFAGNVMLQNSGLGVLSAAEYLATERSYAQIMKNYGLPEGFYDDPSDFAKFIGNNISAAELQQRVSSYADLAGREDPETVAQLASMGLSKGDLLAYMIDPDRAAPLIMKTYQTALIGAAARRSGVVGDNAYLGHLADIGVTEQQAAQGYGLIGGSLDTAEKLSSIYHEDYGLHDMETEVFDNNATSTKKRKRLASQERASFTGSGGTGNLGRDSAGSY